MSTHDDEVNDVEALYLARRWQDTGDPKLLSDAIAAMRKRVAAAVSRGEPDRDMEDILAVLLMARAEQSG